MHGNVKSCQATTVLSALLHAEAYITVACHSPAAGIAQDSMAAWWGLEGEPKAKLLPRFGCGAKLRLRGTEGRLAGLLTAGMSCHDQENGPLCCGVQPVDNIHWFGSMYIKSILLRDQKRRAGSQTAERANDPYT